MSTPPNPQNDKSRRDDIFIELSKTSQNEPRKGGSSVKAGFE